MHGGGTLPNIAFVGVSGRRWLAADCVRLVGLLVDGTWLLPVTVGSIPFELVEECAQPGHGHSTQGKQPKTPRIGPPASVSSFYTTGNYLHILCSRWEV